MDAFVNDEENKVSVTESLRNLNISCTDLTRRAETPKWEAEIDKVKKYNIYNPLYLRVVLETNCLLAVLLVELLGKFLEL